MKRKRVYLAIIFMMICIGCFFVYRYVEAAHCKEIVDELYNGIVVVTNEEGNDITDAFVDKYRQDYKNGNYKMIYERLASYEYSVFMDAKGNKITQN